MADSRGKKFSKSFPRTLQVSNFLYPALLHVIVVCTRSLHEQEHGRTMRGGGQPLEYISEEVVLK